MHCLFAEVSLIAPVISPQSANFIARLITFKKWVFNFSPFLFDLKGRLAILQLINDQFNLSVGIFFLDGDFRVFLDSLFLARCKWRKEQGWQRVFVAARYGNRCRRLSREEGNRDGGREGGNESGWSWLKVLTFGGNKSNIIFDFYTDVFSMYPVKSWFFFSCSQIEDEGNHGNDETRCLILSTLAAHQCSRVSCLLCRAPLPVYDRYPLIDGTFFLSPRQHSAQCVNVSYNSRKRLKQESTNELLADLRSRTQNNLPLNMY